MKTISIALIAAGCLTACQRSPIGPGSSAPVISGVQIGGRREVPPGQTVQISLIATLTDGTTRDVTNEANWTAGDSHVASIAAPGLINGCRNRHGDDRSPFRWASSSEGSVRGSSGHVSSYRTPDRTGSRRCRNFFRREGRYLLCGLPESRLTSLFAVKNGYSRGDLWKSVDAGSDTTLDIELKR